MSFSVLLYACECWTLIERDEARLDAFDMRCQHKILRVAYYKQFHKIHAKAAPAYRAYSSHQKTPSTMVWSCIYNEWTWTVYLKETVPLEDPVDRRFLGEWSSRKTSAN